MKVKAIAKGYYNHVLIEPGVVFEMDDKIYNGGKDKDGNPRPPKWVVPADGEAEAVGKKVPVNPDSLSGIQKAPPPKAAHEAGKKKSDDVI